MFQQHQPIMNYKKCDGVYIEQVIRPTGLLDPIIEIRPSLNQIDDLIEEIQTRAEIDERVLVTTLNKNGRWQNIWTKFPFVAVIFIPMWILWNALKLCKT